MENDQSSSSKNQKGGVGNGTVVGEACAALTILRELRCHPCQINETSLWKISDTEEALAKSLEIRSKLLKIAHIRSKLLKIAHIRSKLHEICLQIAYFHHNINTIFQYIGNT